MHRRRLIQRWRDWYPDSPDYSISTRRPYWKELSFRRALSYVICFLLPIRGRRSGDWVGGTAMDSTALHVLIAQVRGTAAALAEAEQRVASFTAELAQQDRGAQIDANSAQQIRTRISKGGGSGWVPAG
jgi:hypothetical protein